jgi:hypothetical protein
MVHNQFQSHAMVFALLAVASSEESEAARNIYVEVSGDYKG